MSEPRALSRDLSSLVTSEERTFLLRDDHRELRKLYPNGKLPHECTLREKMLYGYQGPSKKLDDIIMSPVESACRWYWKVMQDLDEQLSFLSREVLESQEYKYRMAVEEIRDTFAGMQIAWEGKIQDVIEDLGREFDVDV